MLSPESHKFLGKLKRLGSRKSQQSDTIEPMHTPQTPQSPSSEVLKTSSGRVLTTPPKVNRKPVPKDPSGDFANQKNIMDESVVHNNPFPNDDPFYVNDADIDDGMGHFYHPKDTQGGVTTGSGSERLSEATEQRVERKPKLKTVPSAYAAQEAEEPKHDELESEEADKSHDSDDESLDRQQSVKQVDPAEEHRKNKSLYNKGGIQGATEDILGAGGAAGAGAQQSPSTKEKKTHASQVQDDNASITALKSPAGEVPPELKDSLYQEGLKAGAYEAGNVKGAENVDQGYFGGSQGKTLDPKANKSEGSGLQKGPVNTEPNPGLLGGAAGVIGAVGAVAASALGYGHTEEGPKNPDEQLAINNAYEAGKNKFTKEFHQEGAKRIDQANTEALIGQSEEAGKHKATQDVYNSAAGAQHESIVKSAYEEGRKKAQSDRASKDHTAATVGAAGAAGTATGASASRYPTSSAAKTPSGAAAVASSTTPATDKKSKDIATSQVQNVNSDRDQIVTSKAGKSSYEPQKPASSNDGILAGVGAGVGSAIGAAAGAFGYNNSQDNGNNDNDKEEFHDAKGNLVEAVADYDDVSSAPKHRREGGVLEDEATKQRKDADVQQVPLSMYKNQNKFVKTGGKQGDLNDPVKDGHIPSEANQLSSHADEEKPKEGSEKKRDAGATFTTGHLSNKTASSDDYYKNTGNLVEAVAGDYDDVASAPKHAKEFDPELQQPKTEEEVPGENNADAIKKKQTEEAAIKYNREHHIDDPRSLIQVVEEKDPSFKNISSHKKGGGVLEDEVEGANGKGDDIQQVPPTVFQNQNEFIKSGGKRGELFDKSSATSSAFESKKHLDAGTHTGSASKKASSSSAVAGTSASKSGQSNDEYTISKTPIGGPGDGAAAVGTAGIAGAAVASTSNKDKSSGNSLGHKDNNASYDAGIEHGSKKVKGDLYEAGFSHGKPDKSSPAPASSNETSLVVEVIGVDDRESASKLARKASKELKAQGVDLTTGKLVVNAQTKEVFKLEGDHSKEAEGAATLSSSPDPKSTSKSAAVAAAASAAAGASSHGVGPTRKPQTKDYEGPVQPPPTHGSGSEKHKRNTDAAGAAAGAVGAAGAAGAVAGAQNLTSPAKPSGIAATASHSRPKSEIVVTVQGTTDDTEAGTIAKAAVKSLRNTPDALNRVTELKIDANTGVISDENGEFLGRFSVQSGEADKLNSGKQNQASGSSAAAIAAATGGPTGSQTATSKSAAPNDTHRDPTVREHEKIIASAHAAGVVTGSKNFGPKDTGLGVSSGAATGAATGGIIGGGSKSPLAQSRPGYSEDPLSPPTTRNDVPVTPQGLTSKGFGNVPLDLPSILGAARAAGFVNAYEDRLKQTGGSGVVDGLLGAFGLGSAAKATESTAESSSTSKQANGVIVGVVGAPEDLKDLISKERLDYISSHPGVVPTSTKKVVFDAKTGIAYDGSGHEIHELSTFRSYSLVETDNSLVMPGSFVA